MLYKEYQKPSEMAAFAFYENLRLQSLDKTLFVCYSISTIKCGKENEHGK